MVKKDTHGVSRNGLNLQEKSVKEKGYGYKTRDGMMYKLEIKNGVFDLNRQCWAYSPNGSNGGDNTI
ncbi:hypothetical protein HanPI659440_Chr06g0241611 [Helianthus annuus]|nr:hypothetical protein HanPI659440_Chr06g0241611 [Helianthus annuus]